MIHNKDETPDITREGINIPVGFQADIHFEKTAVRHRELIESQLKC